MILPQIRLNSNFVEKFVGIEAETKQFLQTYYQNYLPIKNRNIDKICGVRDLFAISDEDFTERNDMKSEDI